MVCSAPTRRLYSLTRIVTLRTTPAAPPPKLVRNRHVPAVGDLEGSIWYVISRQGVTALTMHGVFGLTWQKRNRDVSRVVNAK